MGSPAPRGHLAAGEYNGNVVTNLENGETLRIRRVQEKKTHQFQRNSGFGIRKKQFEKEKRNLLVSRKWHWFVCGGRVCL